MEEVVREGHHMSGRVYTSGDNALTLTTVCRRLGYWGSRLARYWDLLKSLGKGLLQVLMRRYVVFVCVFII